MMPFSLGGRSAFVTGALRGEGAKVGGVLDGAAPRVGVLARDGDGPCIVAPSLAYGRVVDVSGEAG